jgi:hypothetical protein
MIDETFGDDDDEVDANFYGRASSSKLLTSVPLGELIQTIIKILLLFKTFMSAPQHDRLASSSRCK